MLAEWLAAGRGQYLDPTSGLTMVELIVIYWRYVRKRYVKAGKPTGEQAAN